MTIKHLLITCRSSFYLRCHKIDIIEKHPSKCEGSPQGQCVCPGSGHPKQQSTNGKQSGGWRRALGHGQLGKAPALEPRAGRPGATFSTGFPSPAIHIFVFSLGFTDQTLCNGECVCVWGGGICMF